MGPQEDGVCFRIENLAYCQRRTMREPASTFHPKKMHVRNDALNKRNTYFWGRKAMAE